MCQHFNHRTKKQQNRRRNQAYSAVSLLRSRSLPREQDQFRAVLLQALHVSLQRFCGAVTATRVDRDANSAGRLFVDACCLHSQAEITELNVRASRDSSMHQNCMLGNMQSVSDYWVLVFIK